MSDDDLPEDLPELPGEVFIPDDLSGLLDGDDGVELLPSQQGGEYGSVMVVAGIDLPARSPYIPQVQPNDDVVIQLPGDKALRYAMAVLAAAHRAHYFAAVRAQMRKVSAGSDDPDGNAKFAMGELIKDLPELDHEATAPLRFTPVLKRSGQPMVRGSLPPHTEAFTGWTFSEACDHAHAVLAQAVVSDLDSAWRTVISVGFEAGEQRGRAAVHDLGNWFYDKPVPFSDQAGDREPFVKPPPTVPGPPPGAGRNRGRKKRRRG